MSGHNFRWMRPDARVSWTYSTRTAAQDVGQPMPASSTLQESPDNGETWLDPGSGGSAVRPALAPALQRPEEHLRDTDRGETPREEVVTTTRGPIDADEAQHSEPDLRYPEDDECNARASSRSFPSLTHGCDSDGDRRAPQSGGSVASAALATTLDEHHHADESEADDLDHGQNKCVSLSITAEKQLSEKDGRPDVADRRQRDHHRPCAPGVPAAKDRVEHLAAPHPTTRNRNSPVTIG